MMEKKFNLLSVLILGILLFGLCLVGCRASIEQEEKPEPKLILRYADNQPEGYPTTEAASYFAKLVEERTGGEILIRIYPNGELGSETSVVDQVRFGGIDMCRACMGTMAGVLPELDVLQLPFLYKDSDHMFRVLDGEIGDRFLESIREAELLGLSWYDAGARSFYTKEPVHTLEELAGLRIRVQESDAMHTMVKLLGAVPVQLDYHEVYSALQTGKIDGADNNIPSYVSAGHYEEATYFLLDEHSRLPEMQIISLKALEKVKEINESYPEVIRECARESALYERKLWKAQEEEARRLALERGCVVVTPSRGELEKFRAAVQPMYDTLPKELQDVIQKIGMS